jgi:hypothetical protein
MKKIITFQRVCVAFVLVLTAACTETSLKKSNMVDDGKPDLNQEEIKRIVLLDTSFLYPEKIARLNALRFADQMLTRKDGKKRDILNVITMPSLYTVTGKTQIKTDYSVSHPETPSMYIYNFKDNLGYIVLSADKRHNKILAVVGAGKLDSTLHVGLKIFLEKSLYYVDQKVAELEALRGDDAFNSMLDKFRGALTTSTSKPLPGGRIGNCNSTLDCGTGGTCHLVSSTTPISSYNTATYIRQPLLQTLWHQHPPYNNYQAEAGCNIAGCGPNNTRYLAGCVPVAEGQIVAYYWGLSNPTWATLNSKTCGDYTPDENNAVAQLVHDIFLQYGWWVDRGCSATGAGWGVGDIHLTNPRGISSDYGFVQGEWRDWNNGDIRSSLANGSPVLIEGFQHLCWAGFWYGCGDGHEWVIDGMIDYGVSTTYNVTAYYTGTGCSASQTNYYVNYNYTTNTTTDTQIHQNWGWGPNWGSDPNDWYEQGIFETSAPHPGDDLNFNHANYIVAYITHY